MTLKTIFKIHANFIKSEIWDKASRRIRIRNFSFYCVFYCCGHKGYHRIKILWNSRYKNVQKEIRPVNSFSSKVYTWVNIWGQLLLNCSCTKGVDLIKTNAGNIAINERKNILLAFLMALSIYNTMDLALLLMTDLYLLPLSGFSRQLIDDIHLFSGTQP